MKRIYLQNTKNQIARPTTIRDINKKIVLNYVRDRSPISRADIARETALQRSTVSAIVDDLQRDGLIEEIGTGDSTGGRKPTLLRIRSGNPVAIGVDITPKTTTIALADLAGTVLEKEESATSPNLSYMTDYILDKVSFLNKEYKKYNLEVGVSIPGLTDPTIGRVLYVPYFQWRDWEISKIISQETKMPVTIENDANAIALAELWFGREEIRRARNFITVLVAEGIGTGIIFDGQIYRGDKGAAGEFGHMIVGENAPTTCSCGSRDCWEAHASVKALITRYHNLHENKNLSADMGFSQIAALAKNQEKQALDALRETTKYLGIGISNLIIGFNPQAIVVSGKITKVWDLIEQDLYRMSERSVRNGLPKTLILTSSLGESPTLLGALSLVLARKFASAN